jgi:hypothetical protein
MGLLRWIFACRPCIDFDGMFSIPREPMTALGPGQYYELPVPTGKKAVITDVYIENLGGGRSLIKIEEQRLPTSFEVRYTFGTDAGDVTIVNYTTGLRLGDEVPIAGSIRVESEPGTGANVMLRVNGILV